MIARVLIVMCAACAGGSKAPTGAGSADPNRSTATGCAANDQAHCATAADCHPVFRLAGDAALFEHCSDGASVNCTKPASNCDEPDPKCGSGAYRVAWPPGGCHDGCVEAARCTPCCTP
jgi:hypothetical protein